MAYARDDVGHGFETLPLRQLFAGAWAVLALPVLDSLAPQLLAGIEPAAASVMVHGLHEAALADFETIGEPNVARAHHVAAAALDAIEEPQVFERTELATFGGKKKLLRHQKSGARFRAVAAANARHSLDILA
jgi:hypothetical protein